MICHGVKRLTSNKSSKCFSWNVFLKGGSADPGYPRIHEITTYMHVYIRRGDINDEHKLIKNIY